MILYCYFFVNIIFQTFQLLFITKNGRGDLAVMSTDLYNKLTSKYELYRLLEQSEDDFSKGHTLSFEESMKRLREGLNAGTL